MHGSSSAAKRAWAAANAAGSAVTSAIGRELHDPLAVHGPPLLRRALPHGPADVPDRADVLARVQPLRDRDHLPLARAVDQEVGRRVREDRGADRVRPVVVVGEPPEGGLDPAEHDRDPGEERVHAVGVDEHGSIGPARNAAGRVRVRRPAAAGSGCTGSPSSRPRPPRPRRRGAAVRARGGRRAPGRAGRRPRPCTRRPRAPGRSRPCRTTGGPRRRPPRRGGRRSRRSRGGRASRRLIGRNAGWSRPVMGSGDPLQLRQV